MKHLYARLLKRVRSRRAGGLPPSKFAFAAPQCTAADIHYCFRLFLQRAPRQDELAYWMSRIQDGSLTLAVLADEFANNGEFLAQQQRSQQVQLVDLQRYRMYVRPSDFSVGAAIAAGKMYEPAVTRLIQRVLQPGDYFLDIGANIGYFTMMAAAQVGVEGKVIAFEPNLENCALIERSAAENGFQNIDLRPFAVAERAQVFVLDTAGSGSNGRVIDASPLAVPGNTPPTLIQAVSIDETLGDLPRLACIKMDIEGAEARALQGMEKLLAAHRPQIITEFSPLLLQTTSHVAPESYLGQLQALGYALHIVGDKSGARSAGDIMTTYARSGRSHLDLLAVPAAK